MKYVLIVNPIFNIILSSVQILHIWDCPITVELENL
jgi:hypothetical protein